MLRNFFVIVLCLISIPSYAFNWGRCRHTAWSGNGVGFTASTTSYISSTGPCAMIGELEHDKKLFIVQNYEELKLDVAMGGGKTLEGYVSLSKVAYSDDLKKSLQMSYANIFKRNELDVEDIYRGLECQMSQKDACVI